MKNSFHEDFVEKQQIKPESDKNFGITFAIIFIIIAFLPILMGKAPVLEALMIAALFMATAFLKPTLLKPLNIVWTKFGLILHKIINPIILGFMFFIILTPIALVMRIFNRDFLKLKFNTEKETYWIKRNPPGPEAKTMEKQF